MVRKILEEKPIPLGQVYELLTIREESGINYVQRVTAQHAEKLSRNSAYSEEVLEFLQNDFGLSRILAVQIVNLNPQTPTDVKAITRETLSADQIEQLLEKYSEFVIKIAASVKEEEPVQEGEEVEEIEEGFEDL